MGRAGRALGLGAWLFAALCMLAGSAHALPGAAHLDVSQLGDDQPLGAHLYALEDATGAWSAEAVARGAGDANYTASAQLGRALHAEQGHVWLRLDTDNPSAATVTWALTLPTPLLATLQLFALRDGRLMPVAAASSARARLPGGAFVLSAAPHERVRYYACYSHAASLYAVGHAHHITGFLDGALREGLRRFMFYGLLAVMIAFNCGAYLLIRQREFASYALFLACELCAHVAVSGDLAWLRGTADPAVSGRAVPLSIALCFVALSAFTRDLLGRYDHLGDLTRSCNLALIGSAGLSLFAALADLRSAAYVVSHALLLATLCTPFILRAVARREDHELWLYNRSWYSVAVLVPIQALRHLELVPPFPFFDWAAELGCALQAVLTSLALAWRVNLMRAQMGELNAQLSHRVGELKTALLHAEAATARAERATKVKDEFIATMSHELRTPLNAVINIPRGLAHDFRDVRVAECHACAARFVLDEGERTDGLSCPDCKTGPLGVQVMLRYRGEPERSLRFLRSVERCGMHLLQMVNGILDISIMDAGRLTLQREHTELGPLIEDAIEELQSVAQARGIVLSAELVQTDEAAVLDPVRIKQVLHNLLSNAVKFSPDGGRVSLRWTRERRGDTIAIEDHGVGIAPENQARIFARFEQVHVGETRKYGGTGLGLSIARSLVRMHGGELWVTSELGRGSTFTFHLPHVSSVPSLSLAHELSAAPTQSGLRARSGAVRPSRVTRS